MSDPWAEFAPTATSSGVPELVVGKKPPPQTAAQAEGDVLSNDEKRRRLLTAGAPEGTMWDESGKGVKPIPGYVPKDGPKPLSPQDQQNIRREAADTINLIRKVKKRLRTDDGLKTPFGAIDLMPETGGIGALIAATGYGDAADIKADIDAIKPAATLSKILQMAAVNGGKNPLTPMSNSDVELIARGIGNLTLMQRPQNLIDQLERYERAYSNAFLGAGGKPEALGGAKPKPKAKAGRASADPLGIR